LNVALDATEPADPQIAKQSLRDAIWLTLVGLLARGSLALWAASRIPPVADGEYYDAIARRIASGLGYTWAWSDGTVTYAAHYPVGYPALVGLFYWLFGAHLLVAMLVNAALGSLAVLATHRIVSRRGDRMNAAVAGALVALHPGLVTYTPALMTEGVAASAVAVAMWLALRARERPSLLRLCTTGIAIASATYLRPQWLLLVVLLPVALSASVAPLRARAARIAPTVALLALSAGLAVAPWTARNCLRMSRCALVSVNDGWNLLIGTDQEAGGTWAPVKVPPDCRDVFDEAEKNRCFKEAGVREIERAPIAWLSLIPAKLARTFNYCGAGPWYLHQANPDAVSDPMKRVLGGIEVVFERLSVAAALIAVARRSSNLRAGLRWCCLTVIAAGLVLNLVPQVGYIAVLCLLVGLVLLLTDRNHRTAPPTFSLAFWVVGATALVHAVFFGAGRYEMVIFPIVSALAAFALRPRGEGVSPSFDTG
jgi:hypothetical protein